MAEQKKIYFSPSDHGVGANKCLHTDCYEDKHTRPIADWAAKYLIYNGFYVVVADAKRSVYARPGDADRLGIDLYVPIHTNAFSNKSVRRIEYMCYNTNGEYLKLFNCMKEVVSKNYDGDILFKKRRDLFEINSPEAITFYCELGFHTNQKDCDEFIHNAKARGKELAQGICAYYGVKFKDMDAAAPAKPATKPAEPAKKPAPAKKNVIDVDGQWGQATTRYTQKLLKTYQDGIVSGQLSSCKKYLPSALTSSWEFRLCGNGSDMVKALQRHIGMVGKDIDGFAGKNTVIALQKFLKNKNLYKGAIDGIMGYATVVAWQKYINSKF